jgi:glycosyltransferase involved in cell wall biosynthesis
MKTVTVIMSSYNGSSFIERQIKSIYNQKDVSINCFIRDDGSSDNTLQILTELQKEYANLSFIVGDNVGWEKSFLIALSLAPQADYYAFADQDDIWFDNKIINGLNQLAQYPDNEVVMFHCNKISVNGDLTPLSHQIKRLSRPINRQNAVVQEYAQGCSIIFNNAAKNLLTRRLPIEKIAHDFWVGLVCFMFGHVIYDCNPYFYHINYGNNASGEGHLLKSWQKRWRMFWGTKNVYYLPSLDLLSDAYVDLLTDEDKIFLQQTLDYKINIRSKLNLLFSLKFRRALLGTLSLKCAIVFNRL